MAGETILIIEDRRENIVHLANNVLKPNGYEVLTAMDGQRGLKRILSDQPDLVIMDLNMPKMDGLEVLTALQERGVEIPVILTTFYGSEQVAQQAMRLGAADYIVKPYEIGDMLAAIQRALARRARPPSTVETAPPLEDAMPLTRQVERWVRDMNILTRVGKALVSHVDMDRVCTRTIEAAIYVTRADHAFLYLLDECEGAELCLCGVRGPEDRQVRLLQQPAESSLALEAIRSGEAFLCPRAPADATLFEIVGHALGSAVVTPLRWQGKPIGALIVAREPGEMAFGEADVEWLNSLADYAAIAVRNARIFQQRAQPPAPIADPQRLTALKGTLEQLAAELQAAAETLWTLTGELGKG
jgi:two-component system NtrC family sensor kinase